MMTFEQGAKAIDEAVDQFAEESRAAMLKMNKRLEKLMNNEMSDATKIALGNHLARRLAEAVAELEKEFGD